MPNIFELARLEVEREGKLNTPEEALFILDRAIEIRRYFDLQERNKKVAQNRRK